MFRVGLLCLLLVASLWAQEANSESYWELTKEGEEYFLYQPADPKLKDQAHLIRAVFESPEEPLKLGAVLGIFYRDLKEFKLLGRKRLSANLELASFSARVGDKELRGRLLVDTREGETETFLLVTPKQVHRKFLEPFSELQTKCLERGLGQGDVL